MPPSSMSKLFTLLLAGALFGAACSGSGDSAPPGEGRTPVASPTSASGRVIGLVGTLSGPRSARGNDAFEGADLGIAQLNRSLDPTELPFELVTLDDEGDATRATELIADLAASERTVGVIFAGPPEALPPADDILAEAGIPALMVFGDLYSARLLRSHLFQLSPPLLWQARRISAYLARDRDYDLVGVLAARSLTGNTAVESMKLAVNDVAGLRLLSRRYDVEDNIAAAVDALRSARVEAIVVEASPRAFGAVLDALAAGDSSYRSTRAARTASLPPGPRKRKANRGEWRPQIIGFDMVMGPNIGAASLPAGTVAAETYARGVDYLPVQSFERFSAAFRDWWDMDPVGWELRSYQAVRMIGWAARQARQGADIARVLETMQGQRFGGLDITLGPDDHTTVALTTIGLWVAPAESASVRERAARSEGFPWVPLARGFSTDGTRTDVLPQDWAALFRNAPPPDGPAPRLVRARFGVATARKDPIH